jgi:Ni/Fe-hydrogenase 1 B-type cytochrome subunit
MTAPTGVLGATPPKPPPPAKPGYRSVYLWHWPLRAMHWFAGGCIAILCVTGLYIGRPYFMTSGEASDHYLMGWVRFIHFSAAGILVATAIVRTYWLFKGNRYERWGAQLSYTLVYLVALIQVFTGFAMYGLATPGGFFASAFGWVSPLLGGNQEVRFIHHVMTWYFVILFPVHVYLSLRADLVHREARVSSIVSGFRFVRNDVDFIDG